MTVDARLARGGVLAVWAAFYLVLWLSGEADRYLGSRTLWLVPFGTILLAVATLAYVGWARRRRRPVALTHGEAVGLVTLLVPLVAVLVVPDAVLGSFAAARKSGETSFRNAVAVPPTPADVSFLDIRVADGDRTFAAEAGIRDGTPVRLLGLVTREHADPAGTFELARFYVGCCAADALPVGVPVDAENLRHELVKQDTWLSVDGKLDRRGNRFVVDAQSIRSEEQPSNPYLSFRR